MAKSHINWSKIKSIGIMAAFFGVFGTMITLMVKEENAKDVVRAATRTTTEQNPTLYSLIDSDTIEAKKGELSHMFNFDFGHVIIMGKINDQKVDTAFTFEQFGKQDRIEQIKLQGCAIAAKTVIALDGKTDKDSVRARDYAHLFQQNHCPKVAQP